VKTGAFIYVEAVFGWNEHIQRQRLATFLAEKIQ